MVDLVLFHHVLGPSAGLTELIGRLEAAGHRVEAPDLFAGRRFDSIEAGAAHVEESIGFPALLERATDVVADLPAEVVYAGVSLGVVPAQYLAQTRPGALGALFLEACLPATEFGDGWPSDVPVQIHGRVGDPFFAGEGDLDNARTIVESAGTDVAELFEYPGDDHLFVDASLPTYDADATDLVVERVLAFLRRVDGGRRG